MTEPSGGELINQVLILHRVCVWGGGAGGGVKGLLSSQRSIRFYDNIGLFTSLTRLLILKTWQLFLKGATMYETSGHYC